MSDSYFSAYGSEKESAPYPQGEKKFFKKSSKGPVKEIIIREVYYPFFVFSTEPLPPEIKNKAAEVAHLLEAAHFTLRTDTVGELTKIFEPILTRKEEYLAWKDFNNKTSKFSFNTESSKILAEQFAPRFPEMKKPVQAFMCRNVRAILGQTVKSPIHLAIVWSADGAQHIRERTPQSVFISHPLAIASSLRVPIFNLQRPDCIARLNQFLVS